MSVHSERRKAVRTFRITGRSVDAFDSIVVELGDSGAIGRGEALGVPYFEETTERLVGQVESLRVRIAAGIDRASLQTLLPPGGARNAIDCALWDLEAKLTGRSIWELTGVKPRELETVFTIGIESTPAQMAARSAEVPAHKLLKVKLDGEDPVGRMRAIREARPDARIVVDANQGWTFSQLVAVAPAMADLGVQLIEQPLPRGADADLESYESPVPLCADESCQHLGELEVATGRYDYVNIKLDKTGGLTHALELVGAARTRGLGVMVGCMGGSSLAVAPAFVIGCLSDLVDIDGPLLLKSDRLPGLVYDGGRVVPFEPGVWG
jgi:L-alanine-DL-glutamate epimerase-like enolase superfamily enzyme